MFSQKIKFCAAFSQSLYVQEGRGLLSGSYGGSGFQKKFVFQYTRTWHDADTKPRHEWSVLIITFTKLLPYPLGPAIQLATTHRLVSWRKQFCRKNKELCRLGIPIALTAICDERERSWCLPGHIGMLQSPGGSVAPEQNPPVSRFLLKS